MSQTNVTSIAYENETNLIDREAVFYGMVGFNSGGDQFIQVHDTASSPTNGDIPKVMFAALAGQNFSLDFGKNGRNFVNGITITNSTTGPTLTLGAADCWFDAQFI